MGSVRPARPRPPARRNSRRFSPSHNRVPELHKCSMSWPLWKLSAASLFLLASPCFVLSWRTGAFDTSPLSFQPVLEPDLAVSINVKDVTPGPLYQTDHKVDRIWVSRVFVIDQVVHPQPHHPIIGENQVI